MTEKEAGSEEGWPCRQISTCEQVCGTTCYVPDLTRTEGVGGWVAG